MELQEQVCSLGFAKKLKELGVEQDSLHCWSDAQWDERGRESRTTIWRVRERAIPEPEYSISAFTVAELGQLLPKGYASWVGENHCACESGDEKNYLKSDTEANARAKMIIWLKEHGDI